MKRTSKIISIILVLTLLLSFPLSTNAISKNQGIEQLKELFVAGEGPVVNGYSVDYSFFSPVEENDVTKYPLVIWLHGMGDGAEPGLQVKKSNIAYWASDEFQKRFDKVGGAFILAARSREENDLYWDNEMIKPLKAAIDDFIIRNKANIDLTRIYIGGYSMGGKMTLKMAIAYPEMFAAAFPICPAWSPSDELCTKLEDTPVWITSSKRDPLVNYYLAVSPTFERITENSNVAEKCRFSSIGKVCYEDGTATSSSHHTWFAVNHDMFTYLNGDYYNMETVNGLGEEVKLEYPDGMISWLSSHTSNYDGAPSEGMGNLENEANTDNLIYFDSLLDFFKLIFNATFKIL